MQKQIK